MGKRTVMISVLIALAVFLVWFKYMSGPTVSYYEAPAFDPKMSKEDAQKQFEVGMKSLNDDFQGKVDAENKQHEAKLKELSDAQKAEVERLGKTYQDFLSGK
mgnify:CR=1 FL=1